MIAKVIVDVSAYPVDRPFDYGVPKQLVHLVEAGSRVKVPFGRRNVLGFIVGFSDTTDVPAGKLKDIAELLDLTPVLTAEMLEMAKWMTQKTLCYEIDALQVMLPNALRAKYEKKVVLNVAVTTLDESLQRVFGKRQISTYKLFEKEGLLAPLKRAIRDGQVEVITAVKQQGKAKTVRKIKVHDDKFFLQELAESMGARAKKQLHVVQWMSEHAGEEFVPAELAALLDVSDAVLKGVVERGAASFTDEETYRDPFSKEVQATNALTLTEEQQQALTSINAAYDAKRAETFLLQGVTGSGKTEVYLQAN